ncbi:hypothetical protein BH10CHL1_BH10CHL1_30920 [soil metagenome]
MIAKIEIRDGDVLSSSAELREKYGLGEDDSFTLLDLGDNIFLLTTRTSIVPALVAEMEALRIEAGVTLDDLLSGQQNNDGNCTKNVMRA